MSGPRTVCGSPFHFHSSLKGSLNELDSLISHMWAQNQLTPSTLIEIYQQSKIDALYHSNRLEGNSLTYGETIGVVEANKEIQGKPLRDQQEARNLSAALDYVHKLGGESSISVTQNEIRRIHSLLLRGIQADAGTYRTTEIKVTGSRYAPPEAFQVQQYMTALSDFVKQAANPDDTPDDLPVFSAAVAHVWLAQIHPFTDGNGRTARALMNLILMRRGYPPCIITEEDRPRYIDSLERSWESGNLTPFIELMVENVDEQRKNRDWLLSVTARLEQAVSGEVEREYQIWRNAMNYLKSLFRHTIDNLNAIETQGKLHWRFADYGELDVVKYDALRSGIPAQKTRYLGIEVNSPVKRETFVFFYGIANENLRQRTQVALMVMKGPAPHDVSLDRVASLALPDLYQIGFDMEARRFIVSDESGIRERDPQRLVQQFFDEYFPRGFRN